MHKRNPFYAFFTFTLLGLFFSLTGAIGWEPRGRNDLLFKGRWVDGPLWGQMGLGIAFLIGAAVAFRYASRAARLRGGR